MTAAHNPESHEFQAEIGQLLDIVIHSLYRNREIFVRELVSNAADALEKIRHLQLTESDVLDKDAPLEIAIEADKDAGTITLRDAGIGMTRDELVENLGTIAHSGTRAFLNALKEAAPGDTASLIGQFGVGFYSAFMVADKVTVRSRSWHPDGETWLWTSDGKTGYSIEPGDPMTRGTEITLHLREDTGEEFADPERIKGVIRQFSSFLPVPVKVGGEAVNTVQAIWTKSKSEVTEEEYKDFYKFVAGDFQEPRYWLHFSADAPLAINALLFVPDDNFERLGLGKLTPGVDLYCRKVLIEKHPEHLLPDWMRFVRGVIDSDDLPLNLSREMLQDSGLIRKISKIITGRFIKYLGEKAKEDAEAYDAFYANFGHFLKEGATSDFQHKDDLAGLLRFESSKTEPGKTTSLPEYVEGMGEKQKAIYFVNGPSREAIEAGPYLEAFAARDIEVLFTHEAVDDFVLTQLGTFKEKPLKSADGADLDLPELSEDQKPEGEALTDETGEKLCGWLKESLGEGVGAVRISERLVNNPAVAVNDGFMTSAMQKVMASVGRERGAEAPAMQWTLEINPRHELVRRLAELHESDAALAGLIGAQLFDSALLAAGAPVDNAAMLARMGDIMMRASEK